VSLSKLRDYVLLSGIGSVYRRTSQFGVRCWALARDLSELSIGRHLTARSAPVLFISDVLHPLDHLAVKRFLNGDMSHRGRRRGAVPMFFVRRKPYDIARPDFLNRTAFALRPAQARRDDQCLTERMCMPRGASTRLECDACATHARRSKTRRGELRCLEQRINPNVSCEPFRGSLRRIL
jgi:hypothetical protein